MIRNRRELEAVAAQWTNRAKNDLRNQMIAFIEANGTNEGELADALAISVDEVDQILNGNGEISLSTFAKILIATDNVIEIKPAALMPRHAMGNMPMTERRMPRGNRGEAPRGGYPMPPMGGMPFPPMGEIPEGFPMPPMGEEMPRFGGMPGMQPKKAKKQTATPNRLPNGRFAPKNAQTPNMQCVRLDEIDFDELGRNELCNIIAQNHWDSEIDLNQTKRGELIEFLNWKMTQPEAQEPTNMDDENARIASMLAEEVARNPHLKEMVKKYLH